ncbi:MAG: non-ribosomal peptide synthetase [Ketobacteraceae bacterium]|nr:non-ribosomal peptide synthetase [Ketobacteraceae bacterium]
MPYARPVSGNEKMYIAGADLSPPFAIQVLVEGTGELSIEALRAAVTQAADATPGSRLRLRRFRRARYEWVDSGRVPPVIALKADWDGNDFADADFLKKPFDLRSGPTCEVFHLSGSGDGKQRLVFRAFHGVMDAQGVQLWVDNVFRALNGHLLNESYFNGTDLALARSLAFPEHRPNFGFDCASATGDKVSNQRGYVWRRARVPGTFPGLVSKLAIILAAASRAHNPGCAVRFMVPVDLRPHLSEGEYATGNLSNPLFIEPQPEHSWTDIYQQIVDALDKKREGMVGQFDHVLEEVPAFLLRWLFGAVVGWQAHSSRFMATGVLSNVGRIRLGAYSSPEFTATAVNFLPFDIPISPLSLVATENDNHLELSISLPAYLADHGRIDSLVTLLSTSLKRITYEQAESSHHRTSATMHSPCDVKVDDEDFNDTSVISMLQSKVFSTPDAPALLLGETAVSYQSLWDLSKQQMLCLHANGVQRGDLVAVLLDRSVELVVNLIAILRLGAAYVPIDPAYPAERIAYIVKDANIALVVTHSACQSVAGLTVPCLNIDEPDKDKGAAITSLIDFVDPGELPEDALAYVIYTSGSTGNPKGVEIEHRQLAHYIDWACDVYANREPVNFPLFTSIAFDLTVTSIFTPLVTGGAIHVVPETDAMAALQRILLDDRVDVIKLTPSHLRLALELSGKPVRLKKMILGGEDLPVSLCCETHQRFGRSIDLINEYGPTEATVGCMIHVFDPEKDRGASVPIGVAAARTHLFVLNEAGQPVRENEIGELYIAGSGLARGYLNRTELTDSRFLKQAFGSSLRLYKTGDLASQNEAGLLEYHGRIDNQIKINGFRIELGEVQAIMKSLSGVDDAVALAVNGSRGERCLYGFYVRQSHADPSDIDEATMRASMYEKLPYFMVPERCVAVHEIPLTVNGKVDSEALISAVHDTMHQSIKTDAATVDRLRFIWSDILGMPSAEIDYVDSFFELGGDSLLMARMLRRVREELLTESECKGFSARVPRLIEKPQFNHLLVSVEAAKGVAI